jgi:hypothetical protein
MSANIRYCRVARRLTNPPPGPYPGSIDDLRLIPTFERSDADILVWSISSNTVIYAEPVLDPLFIANVSMRKDIGLVLDNSQLHDQFLALRPFNTLACNEQYEICNAANGNTQCSGLTGIFDLERTKWTDLGMNPKQRVLAKRISRTLYYSAGLQINGATGTTGMENFLRSYIQRVSANPKA